MSMKLCAPHERPQLLTIVVGGGAELLFKLAHCWNRVLEGILPRLECPRIRRLIRHGHCVLCKVQRWACSDVNVRGSRCSTSAA